MAVFRSGIEKGSKAFIPVGGQLTPISIEGDKLLWKKAQKKEKKNKISETINNINPSFKPYRTEEVWNPSIFDSVWISVNHIPINNKINKKLIIKGISKPKWK